MEFKVNVVAQRSVVRESLKGIIWTIFFHRLFGPITPTTSDFFNVSYPMANDTPEIDSQIDENIDTVIKRDFEMNETKYSQITINFYDPKTTKSKKKGWFGGKEEGEDVRLWESWTIYIKCLPISQEKLEKDPNISLSITSFETALLQIIDTADIHKDHIPPITSLESSPFPYKIDITKGDDTWGSYIKKILD